jgi:membrane protein required for colicin V production
VNAFDAGVVAIIVLSGLFAFARGLVRELLSIASWLGATFAALYGLPFARPIAEGFLPKGPISDGIAALAIFIVSLFILSLIAASIARHVKRSSLSAVDRTFGLIFGLLRGVLIVCIAYLALSWVMPPGKDQPRWLAQARTHELLGDGADFLQQFVPARLRQRATTALSNPDQEVERAIRAYRTPGPHTVAGDGPVYTPDEQRDLNRLIQQQGGKP